MSTLPKLTYEGVSGSSFPNLSQLDSLAQQEMAFNALEAQKARDFNAEQAQINRDWQEQMSNTAVERQYSQYKALGINPYAMLSHGTASTPSGSSASGSSATYSGYAAANRSASASESNTKLTTSSNERIAIINGLFKTLSAFAMAPIKK